LENHNKGKVNALRNGRFAGSVGNVSELGRDRPNILAKNPKTSWPYVGIPDKIIGNKSLIH
jgi:hypothetical protein